MFVFSPLYLNNKSITDAVMNASSMKEEQVAQPNHRWQLLSLGRPIKSRFEMENLLNEMTQLRTADRERNR